MSKKAKMIEYVNGLKVPVHVKGVGWVQPGDTFKLPADVIVKHPGINRADKIGNSEVIDDE